MPTSQDTRGEPSNHFRWTWVTTSQRVTHLPIAVSWSCTSPSLPLTALSSSGCEQLSAARPACRHNSASQELGTSYSPPRLTNSAAPAPDQKSEFRKLIPSFPDLPKVNVRLYSFKTPAQLNSSTFSCFSVLFYNNNQRWSFEKMDWSRLDCDFKLLLTVTANGIYYGHSEIWDMRAQQQASWDQGLQEIFL